MAGSPRTLRRGEEGFLPWASERVWSCPHLDFRLLSSRAVREFFPVKPPNLWDLCYISSRKWIYHPSALSWKKILLPISDQHHLLHTTIASGTSPLWPLWCVWFFIICQLPCLTWSLQRAGRAQARVSQSLVCPSTGRALEFDEHCDE